MRRMYSQAELSAIIKEVFLADVASGEIDLPALIEQTLPEIDFSELDFVAKTIEQAEANWVLPVTIPSVTNFEGDGYYAIKKVNGEIHIIFAVAYKNTSGATANFSLSTFSADMSSLPVADTSKIIDMSGKNLTEDPGSITTIRIVPVGTFASGTGAGTKPLDLRHNSANNLQFYWTVSFSNVPSDGYVIISFEINLDVL